MRLEQMQADWRVKPSLLRAVALAFDIPPQDVVPQAVQLGASPETLGPPMPHAIRRPPLEYLYELLKLMERRRSNCLMLVNVTSDRHIDNEAFVPIFRELFKLGLYLVITSGYPNGDYIRAQRGSIPNLAHFYNSVFGRVCAIAGFWHQRIPQATSQVCVARLNFQPSHKTKPAFRLSPPALGVTDVRPCFFFFPGRDRLPETTQVAAFTRIGGNRADQWLILYPSEGDSDEQERAAEVRDTWRDYFTDIITNWPHRKPDKDGKWPRLNLAKDSNKSWYIYDSSKAE